MSLNISKIKNCLSVIILCGGQGQRLRPLTQKIPKPLIKIKNKAIIEYIINHFFKYKINNIIVVTGNSIEGVPILGRYTSYPNINLDFRDFEFHENIT